MESLRLSADLCSVRLLGAWLNDIFSAYSLVSPNVNSVELALVELCNNIIVHGYCEAGDSFIDLNCKYESEVLSFVVSDSSKEVSLISAKPVDNYEDVTVHGYGLMIISQLADSFTVDRCDGINVWTLEFGCKRG